MSIDREEQTIEAEERMEMREQMSLDEVAAAPDMTAALITVSGLPEIKENLRSLRDRWEQRVLDAESMVCTEESVQVMKNMRAEMRKEYEAADEQRKAAKVKYIAPWNDVEKVWKECVETPFKKADTAFKSEISGFEGQIKAKCIEELQVYYRELQKAEGMAWLPFDRAMSYGNIKVNLSDAKTRSARRLKDALAQAVSGVALDMERIRKMDSATEIMAEYKISLNVGAAVAAVQDRRRREQAEKERYSQQQEMEQRRAEAIAKLQAAATPPVTEAPQERPPEKIWKRFTFTVLGCNRSQLIKIRDFLIQEGISYE